MAESPGESQAEKKKLSKSEKKAARKQAKSQHLLLKHDGIATSDVPTKVRSLGKMYTYNAHDWCVCF